MHKLHVILAWKWLLTRLVLAAAVGYIFTFLLVGLGLFDPATILDATTIGVRHVAKPVLNQGMSFGIDGGIMLFYWNLSIALVIVSIVYWAKLHNPNSQEQTFLRLRKYLQKDCSTKKMRKIPPFAHIKSSQLCVTSFQLLVAPTLATVCLGVMVGAFLGSIHLLSSSPLIALAYIMPHGIPEIAALLLACSIPVGTWMVIRPVVDNEHSTEAFRRIDRVVASQQLQQSLKMIACLLLVAGMIEAHLTLKVVAMVSGS